jgi:hypothetical protein
LTEPLSARNAKANAVALADGAGVEKTVGARTAYQIDRSI